MVAHRFNQRVLAEANAMIGQTMQLILLSGTSVGRNAADVTAVVADEISSVTGYTTRPTVTISGSPTYDNTNKRVQFVVTGLSVTATSSAINFQNFAVILGGSTTLGGTSGSLYLLEEPGSQQTIAVNTTKQFPITLTFLDSASAVGD